MISEKKLAGILSLVKKKLIPSSFHRFYESMNGADADSDNEDEFSESEDEQEKSDMTDMNDMN